MFNPKEAYRIISSDFQGFLNAIAATESVTNSTITAGFLSNITLLNYSAGILDINM